MRYETGADIRIQHDAGRIPRAYSGASRVVPDSAEVMRTEGSLLTEGFGSQRVSVLAVESERLAEVAWWREDFGEGNTLAELMAAIEPDREVADGLPLPEGTSGLSLWARTGDLQSRLVSVSARVRDGAGRNYDLPLGDVTGREWVRLESDLALRLGRTGRPTDNEERPRIDQPPHTLINLQIVGRTGGDRPGVLFIDELSAQTPGGDVVIAPFDTADGWGVIEGLRAARPVFAGDQPERITYRSWRLDGFQLGARRHRRARPEARRPHGAVAGGGEPRDPGSRRGGGRRPHQPGHVHVCAARGDCGGDRLLPDR